MLLKGQFLRSFLALMTLFAISFAPASAEATLERYTGTARDQSGAILYQEKHEVQYQSGKVLRAQTRYLSADGKPLAELDSDFSANAFLPKYRFRNLITSLEEGVECCSGDELEVFHQNKRKKLKYNSSWVSGQGFHYLAKDRLEKVDQNEKQHFKFLIPSKLDSYNFRLSSAGRDDKNPDYERVLLEIDHWFFRLFAPKIVATYDIKTRRLMRYEGPSNIELKKGEIKNVTIEYSYDP